ncbi:hypothetical protein GQ457_13G018670 [Hibiscus cannabinus]
MKEERLTKIEQGQKELKDRMNGIELLHFEKNYFGNQNISSIERRTVEEPTTIPESTYSENNVIQWRISEQPKPLGTNFGCSGGAITFLTRNGLPDPTTISVLAQTSFTGFRSYPIQND